MRAVGPTIDAGEPTHSTTAHPKHLRALSASPAQWRDGCIAARGAAEPGPLALTLRTLWAFRATSAALSELGQTGRTGQTGECAPGVVASSRLSPAHARRASCHRRTKERGWQWVKFLARWVQAEVAGRSRAWCAPGTRLARARHALVARHWQVIASAQRRSSGGRAAVRARIHRGRAQRAGAFFPHPVERISSFTRPSARPCCALGKTHPMDGCRARRLRPSGEQSGDTWVARTCSRLRARSHW